MQEKSGKVREGEEVKHEAARTAIQSILQALRGLCLSVWRLTGQELTEMCSIKKYVVILH